MTRIFVVVEGETEERFVKTVLRPVFFSKGIQIEAQQWPTNRRLGTAGGGGSFAKVENHINRLVAGIASKKDVYVTTMIDFYGFPRGDDSIFKEAEITLLPTGLSKVEHLEKAFSARIPSRFFIPYIQLHEFEALLLTRPEALLHFYTEDKRAVENLKAEIGNWPPEEINHTSENAPSKRIIRHFPRYEKGKTTAGITAIQSIGLDHLMDCCPHFNSWISRLLEL